MDNQKPNSQHLTPLQYLEKAQDQREGGSLDEAIKSAQYASKSLLKESNYIKAAEAKCSEMLSFIHLYGASGNTHYIQGAKAAINEAFNIMKNSPSKAGLGRVYYNLGKYYQAVNDYNSAINYINQALALFEQEENDDNKTSKAQIFEAKTRLAALQYWSGDNEAMKKFDESIEELKQNPHKDEYTQNVWVSGAYLHMAEILIAKGDRESVSDFINSAEEVIGENAMYKLRRDQIDRLKQKSA